MKLFPQPISISSTSNEYPELLTPSLRNPQDRNFQTLIKQSLLGLPIEPFLRENPNYQIWYHQVQETLPEIWSLPDSQKAADYTIQHPYQDVILSSQYDLLLANTQAATIIQWTSAPLSIKATLNHRWETQLALFLLVEGLDYQPDQIQLTYWFLKSFKAIKFVCHWSRGKHEQFQEKLNQTINSQPELDLTSQFLNGQLSLTEYLAAIPEVEI
jgi:hypothetical protein